MAFESSVEGGWQEYDVVGVYVGVDDLFVGFLACGQQAGAQVSTPGDGSSAACGFHVFDPEAFAGSLADSRAGGGVEELEWVDAVCLARMFVVAACDFAGDVVVVGWFR